MAAPACLRCHRLSRWLVGPFTHAGPFTPASAQSVRCLREPQRSAFPACIFPCGERPAHCTPTWNAPLRFSPLGWSLQPDGTSLGDALEAVTVLINDPVKVSIIISILSEKQVWASPWTSCVNGSHSDRRGPCRVRNSAPGGSKPHIPASQTTSSSKLGVSKGRSDQGQGQCRPAWPVQATLTLRERLGTPATNQGPVE